MRYFYLLIFLFILSESPVFAATQGAAIKHTAQKKQEKLRNAVAPNTAESLSVVGSRYLDGVTNKTPGGGLLPRQNAAKSVSEVTRDYIAKQNPASNIQSLVGALPGVVTASSDPLGMLGDGINIRGMNEQQIGYLLEGAPLADQIRYTPYTETMVDTENIQSVKVNQGAADIDSPLYNAVGGTIAASVMKPTHVRNGYISALGGTKSANKEFVRFNTGDIGHTDLRAFASFSHISDNNWRGPGNAHRYHVDAMVLKDIGRESYVSAFGSYNISGYTTFLFPNLQQWKTLGRGDNLSSSYYPGNSSYYRLNRTNRNSATAIANGHFVLGQGLSLNLTSWYNKMWGPYLSGFNISDTGSYNGVNPAGNLQAGNYTVNPAGTITTQYNNVFYQQNSGLNAGIEYKRGINTLSFGYTYSYVTQSQLNHYDVVNYGGVPVRTLYTASGALLSGSDINMKQQSNMLRLSDRLSLLGARLEVEASLRAAMLTRWGTNLTPGADPAHVGKSYFEPLPSFSVLYHINAHDSIYIDGTTAFRAPNSIEAYVQDFYPTAAHATSQPGSTRPEYSIGEEIGFRHYGPINASVAFFNYNLTNHLVSSSSYIAGTNTLITQIVNAGGQTARGVDAEAGLSPWHGFSPYISFQYLHATTDSNIAVGSDYLPTKGKESVQSPRYTGALSLAYDSGRFFGNFSLRYVGSQFSTFMNDQKIPSYVTSNLTLGYRAPTLGIFKRPTIQLNIVNIGDNNYLSGVNGVVGTAVRRTGLHGTTVAAGTPTYIIGAGFGAFASVSSGF